MAKDGWHIIEEAGGVTLARRLPARFDVSSTAHFPAVQPLPLASQIRQDLWRMLQSLRGFSPVVQVVPDGEGLRVEAGGQVHGVIPPATSNRIAALLSSVHHRDRWVWYARERG